MLRLDSHIASVFTVRTAWRAKHLITYAEKPEKPLSYVHSAVSDTA